MAYFVPHGTNDLVGSRRQYGRLHVVSTEWAQYPEATDFWLSGAGSGDLGTATGINVLADAGWTTTSMVHATQTGADFLTAADIGTPNGLLTNGASDLVSSPVIFGDFMAMQGAANTLGYLPKHMMLEAYLTFGVASNNETTTRFGFFEAGGSPIVNNDAMASMYSDGTNFVCGSGADTDVGAVVQTTPFGLRIRISPGTTEKVEWFLRLTMTGGFASQGTFNLQTDLFPCGFGFGQGTSNTISAHWAHIWYSESPDFD